MRNSLLPVFLLLLVFNFPQSVQADDARPNFVLIFIDDMGYADVGCFGADDLKTPHIDSLAADGMKFTSYYAAPVCSMSRAALMTGCYNPRVSIPGVLFPASKIGLHDDETTVAELLRSQGYATACIGKWHLGWQEPFLPKQHGFDYYFGLPYSNDMGAGNRRVPGFPPLPLYRNNEVIETEPDQAQLTRRYTEEAIRFITDHQKEPFFVYLPHTMVHRPLAASKEFRGKSKRGAYGDAVEEIDWSVGKILAALDELHLADRTVVMFTSDNGPGQGGGGSAAPLRGHKGTTYEGGVRTPTVIRWPSQTPAATTCNHLVGNIDVLPTFAALAGAPLPTERKIDGVDFSAALKNPQAKPARHVHLYYFNDRLEAIRIDQWKLRVVQGKTELFNLADDLPEAHNVAAAHPDIVARLQGELLARKQEIERNQRPAGKVAP